MKNILFMISINIITLMMMYIFIVNVYGVINIDNIFYKYLFSVEHKLIWLKT
jgi:hypothetical protein